MNRDQEPRTCSVPSHYLFRTLRAVLLACSLFTGLSVTWAAETDVAMDAAENYYWQGIQALDTGHPRTAADLFERALMENPDHAGAWFDYGLTLCRLGERASCRALLAEALSRFGPPPALAGRERRLDWVFNGELRTAIGHSSNLSRGIASGEIRLLIDGREVFLPVAASLRPQPSGFTEAGTDLRWRRPVSGFEVGLTAYRRSAVAEAVPNLQAVALDAGWDLMPGHRAGLLAYHVEERSHNNSPAIAAYGLWWERAPDRLQPRLALTLEQRETGSPHFTYLVTRLEAGQRLSDWGGRAGIDLQATAETETRSSRPGAAQSRLALALKAPVALRHGTLDIFLRGQYARDAQAYSPLLGDMQRRARLLEASIRYTLPLGEQLALRAEVRANRQASNIALFQYNEQALSLGLAYRW